MSSLFETTLKSVIWKLIEKAGTQVISFVFLIFLARLLGPEEFACIALLAVVIAVGDVFVQGGFTVAIIQAKEESKEICTSIFWIEMAISALIVLILYFGAGQIADFFKNEKLAEYVKIIAMIFPLNTVVSIQTALLTRHFEFKKLCWATFLSTLIPSFCAIGMAFSGMGIYAYIFQQIGTKIILIVILRRSCYWRPELSFSYFPIQGHLKFAGNIFLSRIISVIYDKIYEIVIGKYYSASQLSFFSFGKKIPTTVWGLVDGTLQSVLLPALSKLSSREAVRERLRFAMSVSTYLITYGMLLLALCSEPLIGIVFGDNWLRCVPFLQVYCFFCIVTTITTNNLQAIYATGNGKTILRLEVTKKPFGFASLFLALVIFDSPIAIAAAELFYSFIALAINALPNRKIINYSYRQQFFDIIPVWAVGAFSFVIVRVSFSNCGFSYWLLLIINSVLYSLLYFGLSWVFKIPSFFNLIRVVSAIVRNPKKRI